MPGPLDDVCCASLPAGSLGALASLRRRPGVVVRLDGEGGRAWVAWPPGDAEVLCRVMAAPGAELFDRRGGAWHRHGASLPAFDVPPLDDARPLHAAIVPARFAPEPPPDDPGPPALARLARDDHPRAATALRCSLKALARWADSAPTARIESLRAAWSGDTILAVGRHLPPVAGAGRFWGEKVLAPLGYRPEPATAESALRAAFGVARDELLVLDADGAEVVPVAAFRPLSRGGVRLAAGGGVAP